MANESIRIRTKPGTIGNIRFKLEQDFDFLEILSLRINQEDLYQTFCADYGVVVGRVIVNNGYGVPNAKVSVFVPITSEDEKNTLIKDFYPFKTPYQKDNQGIRYNLLLSKQTCILNTPVGTFPSKEEVLDNNIILEVFDKYYKYTTKTNQSGDFMIFGVPVGQQSIHMDVDLSDIGKASVRPYDMIAAGYPKGLFKSETEFKSSTDLDSLPQIKTANISVDVVPFWGDPENCEIGITRVDFDTKFNVTSTALFFGSIFTDSNKYGLGINCKPDNGMGDQGQLITGPGDIKAIRVSDYDTDSWMNGYTIKPVSLEYFELKDAYGELIDSNGVFAFPLPMNLGHVITDEFGVLVPSSDPDVGLATKGMYRFAINFNGSQKSKYRTATMLFPSLGEDFGGTRSLVDAGGSNEKNGTQDQRFTDDICQYNLDLSKCDGVVYPNSRIYLDFHLFEFKQIYTIAQYLKKYKRGSGRNRFIGVKNTDVSGDNSEFPFTNAVWQFDILYYIIAGFLEIQYKIIRFLIVLISLCVNFCFKIRIHFYLLKYTVDSGYIVKRCKRRCPFIFLKPIVETIKLSCSQAPEQPDGNYYRIPPNGPSGWAECDPNNQTCGGSSDCSCEFDSCQFNIIDADTILEIGLGVYTTVGGEACIDYLLQWLCCAKLDLAEARNTIRKVFVDSWVFGTAYLFKFKYKIKGDGTKEKFCGPGANVNRASLYSENSCCPETTQNYCSKCLLRGPKKTTRGSGSYHNVYHNLAVDAETTGSVDLGDIIYCNKLSSTKIVSLGYIEMCEEVLEEIQTAINANQVLSRYVQTPNFYTGTFYEKGWDVNYWYRFLTSTSYQDPRDVLQYLAKNQQCALSDLFTSQQGCHEQEMKPTEFFFMKEVSKFYTDVETVETPAPFILDLFGGSGFGGEANPYASPNDPPSYGGFIVTRDLANRFSPCGSVPGCGSNIWTNSPSLNPDPEEATSNSWDRITSSSQRNNNLTRSNIPYYYFGLVPGATALDKLRGKFFRK